MWNLSKDASTPPKYSQLPREFNVWDVVWTWSVDKRKLMVSVCQKSEERSKKPHGGSIIRPNELNFTIWAS
jgi:hypothetical protein